MTCAYAVRGALQKLSGVEKVDVSLNKGLATVTLKPGNTVRLPDVWEAVRKNGFSPKETRVVLRGEVVGGSKTELKITGTNEVYVLLSDPKTPKRIDDVRRHAGKTVTLEEVLQPGKDSKTAVPLTVTAVKELVERGK
jgi:copper chaperone CopZ